MRFTTRLFVVQLLTAVAVVAVCTAVFLVLAVQQLRAESEAAALNIARTVAEGPEVRELVTGFSADPGTPEASALVDGPLQKLAGGVSTRTDALFVVIADDHGIRLAHPNPDLLGQVVSTPFAEVLTGREVVDWERGTLGESARAKVPVYPPDGGEPVGEVSVGFEVASVFDDLPALLGAVALAALGAIALAGAAGALMRRRWERVTLGLQPEELVSLLQNQAAVLEGVGDGVIARSPDGVVQVCNTAAERALGLRAPLGRTLAASGAPDDVVRAIEEGGTADGIVVGGHVLYLDTRPVRRDGRDLGDIVIVRDRTDLVALSERLETVRAMTNALRVQRHEFANRMHVAAGLIDAQRVDDARDFLDELATRGAVDYPIASLELVGDPFLRAFLGAKGIEAGEKGVRLAVGDDTLVLGRTAHEEDAAAILGILIDNAVAAAVDGPPPRQVQVSLLDDGDALVLTVADSGAGVPPGRDVFASPDPGRGDAARRAAEASDAVHGHGIGLTLARELARHRGGEVWLIDPGGRADGNPDGAGFGAGFGAVFGARLPGSMQTVASSAVEEQQEEEQ